jgi:hypothetical protein
MASHPTWPDTNVASYPTVEERRFSAAIRAEKTGALAPAYVMLTSVYVPYTCRSASQISPIVA